MKNKKREGERRKFGGVGRKEGENCRQTIQKSSCLQENLKIKLFAKKFKHIYCKCLHGE